MWSFDRIFFPLFAFASIPALAGGWKTGRPLVWIFNIFGSLDLLVWLPTSRVPTTQQSTHAKTK
jgi:hypothetical protein